MESGFFRLILFSKVALIKYQARHDAWGNMQTPHDRKGNSMNRIKVSYTWLRSRQFLWCRSGRTAVGFWWSEERLTCGSYTTLRATRSRVRAQIKPQAQTKTKRAESIEHLFSTCVVNNGTWTTWFFTLGSHQTNHKEHQLGISPYSI